MLVHWAFGVGTVGARANDLVGRRRRTATHLAQHHRRGRHAGHLAREDGEHKHDESTPNYAHVFVGEMRP
jgi:hypothetical protein